MFALVEAGFGQRRKMLRRSLADHATVDDLTAAGIRPEARAEELELRRLDPPGRSAVGDADVCRGAGPGTRRALAHTRTHPPMYIGLGTLVIIIIVVLLLL